MPTLVTIEVRSSLATFSSQAQYCSVIYFTGTRFVLRQLRCAAVTLTLLSAGACASSSSRSSASEAVHRTENALDASDIASTGATNLYDAIQRLRPQWLTSTRNRGGGSGDDLVVYLESTRYGTLNSLRGLTVGGVQGIRYYSASDATNRYGTGHTGGAIVVLMSKQ